MISHPLARNGVALAVPVGAHTEFNFSHKESWQKITASKPWNYPRYCPLCSANEILQKTLWKRRTWWLTLRNPFCTGQHSYTQKCRMTGRAASSSMRKVRCLALHRHTNTHARARTHAQAHAHTHARRAHACTHCPSQTHAPLPLQLKAPRSLLPPIFLPLLVFVPCPWLTTRSDKKLRPVKSEPDGTCPFCSQKRTEIKHLWNCCDHNLQNTELLPAVGFPNQRFHNRDAGTKARIIYL